MKNRTGIMLFTIALGTFVSALDASVVNISYPYIMNDFGISHGTVEWVIAAYLLVVSSELLFFGRLSDIYGQKRVYLTGFAVFTIGSALCSLSGTVGALIAFRVFQAIGAGMMFATGTAIITHNVPAQKRGRSFSVISMAVAVALSSGPVLGGVLTNNFGWQSIFYVNVPVGAVGIFLAAKFLPADSKTASERLDLPGSILILLSLLLILIPLDQSGEGMNIYLGTGMLIAGIVLAVLFVRHEKKDKAPLLKLSLFKTRVFSAGLAAATLNFIAQNIMLFLLPLFLQTVYMKNPQEAGLFIVPMPLTMLVLAPVAGYLADRTDTRVISSVGMAVMACGLIMLSFLSAEIPGWYIRVSMIVVGLGSGLFQTPNNSAVMNHVPAENRGIASGMLATARNMGMVIGVGLSGALFSLFSGNGQSGLIQQGLSGEALESASFTAGMSGAFIVAAFVALASMAASLTKGKVRTGAMLEESGKHN